MKKSRKKARAAKIVKKLLPGTSCLAKNRFSIDFGVPAGAQNPSKMVTKKKSKKRLKVPTGMLGANQWGPIQKIQASVKRSD